MTFGGTLLRLFSRLAVRIDLVDYPGRRKSQRGEIPLIGGPAITCVTSSRRACIRP